MGQKEDYYVEEKIVSETYSIGVPETLYGSWDGSRVTINPAGQLRIGQQYILYQSSYFYNKHYVALQHATDISKTNMDHERLRIKQRNLSRHKPAFLLFLDFDGVTHPLGNPRPSQVSSTLRQLEELGLNGNGPFFCRTKIGSESICF